MQTTVTLKKVSVGTELNIVQEGIPDAIPAEACYLGWQESLTLLATAGRGGDPGLSRWDRSLPLPLVGEGWGEGAARLRTSHQPRDADAAPSPPALSRAAGEGSPKFATSAAQRPMRRS